MLFCSVSGCMLCLVCYLFVISTSVIDCLGRFVPEMTYYVSSGTLNLTKLNWLLTRIKVDLFEIDHVEQLEGSSTWLTVD